MAPRQTNARGFSIPCGLCVNYVKTQRRKPKQTFVCKHKGALHSSALQAEKPDNLVNPPEPEAEIHLKQTRGVRVHASTGSAICLFYYL